MKHPLRLCFVVNDFPRLSETFIARQIIGMIERGHDVTVVCDRIVERGTDPHEEPLRTLLAHAKPRWYLPHFTNRLLEHSSGKLRGSVVAVSDILHDRHLNRYDVLIAHFSHTGMRLARSHHFGILKTPFATYLHGYDIGIPFHSGRTGRFAWLYRHGTILLPVCRFFADMLMRDGVDAARMRIHRMGVDVRNTPFIDHARMPGRLEIITACRHVEKKGLRYSIEALADLSQRRPDIAWHYTLVGDGPLQSGLKALAAGRGLADRMTFTGALPNTTVQRMLLQADVMLQPSVTAADGDIEGSPVVLSEAMASGLPVISSFHSGIPELVTDGQTGLLAPERDVAALSRHIEWVADHPGEAAAMARRARAFVEEEFDNDRLNDELCEIVESIMQGRHEAHACDTNQASGNRRRSK